MMRRLIVMVLWSVAAIAQTHTTTTLEDTQTLTGQKTFTQDITITATPSNPTDGDTVGARNAAINSGTLSAKFSSVVVGAACPSGVPAGSVCAVNTIDGATPVIDVRAYGADPSMTTDSTTAIYNAAVASCSTSGVASGRVVPLYFSPGIYLVTDLDLSGLSCAPMLWGLDDNSATLQYGGNTTTGTNANGVGEYVVRLPAMSFGGVEGLGIYGNNPTTGAMASYGVWMTGGADNGFRLNHARFAQTLSHAIYSNPITYSANASTTSGSTTVSVPSVATSGLVASQTIWLLGAGVAGANYSTTVSSINTGANTITVALAPSTTITGTAVIAKNYQTGYVNWHMERLRFDGVGGCAVYINGSVYDENRPFSMAHFTLDNHYPGAPASTWLTTNSLGNGTNWGDAVVCENNAQGNLIRLSDARVEMNSPQIVQGNLDNGFLLRAFNTTPTAGGVLDVSGVEGYASTGLNEAMVSFSGGPIQASVEGGSGFNVRACLKNIDTQTWYGDKYCGQVAKLSYGYNGQQEGGVQLGSTSQGLQKIESLPDPNSSTSYASFSANDIVLHPASEAAAGAKGPIRYVTATGLNSSGVPIQTGTCAGVANTVTSTGVVTSGSNVISLSAIPSEFVVPGMNVTVLGAGPSGANLTTQVTAINYTSPYSITIVDNASTSVAAATVNRQQCTFRETPGGNTASTQPTSGSYFAGERVWNTNAPSGSQPMYWMCTATGNPCGAWTAVYNTVSGGTRMAYGFCTGTASASSTLGVFELGSTVSTCSGATLTYAASPVMAGAGTASNLSVRCITGGISSASGVFTLLDYPNGSGTATVTPVTVTYGTTSTNTVMQDTTHTYNYAAGDHLAVRFTTQASETLANCSVSFNY